MGKTHLPSPPILFIFLLSLLRSTAAQSPNTPAMLDLKKNLVFPNLSWWSASDPCTWEDVGCESNRVTRIQIGDQSVKGTLPVAVSKLSELRTFEVMRNQLTGPLPSFSGLSALQDLLLNENQFSEIPDNFFDGLTSLQNISLDKNPFKPWKIPESLKSATAL